jgi:hypothetical protein
VIAASVYAARNKPAVTVFEDRSDDSWSFAAIKKYTSAHQHGYSKHPMAHPFRRRNNLATSAGRFSQNMES